MMNRQNADEQGSQVEAKKRPYSAPALRIYGSVGKLTQGGVGSATDASVTAPTRPSDRSAKENIVRVGDHPLGIGLYLFDFKPRYRDLCGHGRQFGVMADEVEAVMPQAVSRHPDGYQMVDYGMLGMKRTPN